MLAEEQEIILFLFIRQSIIQLCDYILFGTDINWFSLYLVSKILEIYLTKSISMD